MRKLFHNCKGAVTVMVTLLLIPSILVSGTGVDLARIYTAKSIVQDANQLAANSVLASYEALLQDLYGLFGVMSGGVDPDSYIEQAVMGGDWDKGMGTFQVFYGSNLNPAVLTPAPGQSLGNVPVLRRQIEEYSKFRAPPIIAELLMSKLEIFEKIKEDAKVIKKKMEVDDGVEELEKYYKKIYDHVQELEDGKTREEEMMRDLSATAAGIQRKLGEMADIKDRYERVKDSYERQEEIYNTTQDEEARAAAKEQMDELKETMERLEMEYDGYWTLIQRDSKGLKERCKKYESALKRYINKLEDLLSDCKKAEEKKAELQAKIQELRGALEGGGCSTTLKDGLTEPEEDAPDGLSILERYEALLKYDIGGMGQAMYDHDVPQITETIQIIQGASLGGILLTNYCTVNQELYFPLNPDAADAFSEAAEDSTDFKPYVMPNGKAYLRFEEGKPPESQEFWDELQNLYDDTGGGGAKKKTLNNAIGKVFKKSQSIFKNLFKNFDPEGANKLRGGVDESREGTGSKFGTGDNWKDKDDGKEEMEDCLDGDFLGKLAGMASEVGNKLLLLVYDTEMFSDFSTPGKDDEGYPKKNMAGIPLSVEVNYYFQSELEYLYNGNLANAVDNLKSVAGMMLLVRFVMDYVASFGIPEVNSVVSAIKGAMAWSGPFAILAGELARLALSIGEAAIDVSRLRDGQQVAVFKTPGNWTLSIAGMTGIATDELSDSALDAAFKKGMSEKSDSAEGGDEGITMGYTDYMRLFLMLVPGDTLADRTRNLIELNVTNYKGGLEAKENEMEKAERYDLGKLMTGFSLTTTVDLRMLFLSMPFAQEGINGVIPPKTLAITATDYRGY